MRFDKQEGKSVSDNGGTHDKQDNGIVMQKGAFASYVGGERNKPIETTSVLISAGYCFIKIHRCQISNDK